MSRKIEIKEEMVYISRDVVEDLVEKLNMVYDYVSEQMERYREREDDRLVTMQEVILYLRIGKSTAYGYVKDGLLIPEDLVGKYRFRLGTIKEAYKKGVIKSTKQDLQNLIDSHEYKQHYTRFDIKSDK